MTTQSNSRTIDPYCGHYRCTQYRDGTEDTIDIITADETVVATTQYWDDHGEKGARIEATMILLSAAPELKEMLRKMLNLAKQLPVERLDTDFYAAEIEAEELLASLIVRLP